MKLNTVGSASILVAALALAGAATIFIDLRQSASSATPLELPDYEMSSVSVTGDIEASSGGPYSGLLTLSFLHHADGGVYSTSHVVPVSNGSLDATVELPAVHAGETITVEAWEGRQNFNRNDAVFYASTEGHGFVRVVQLRDRNGVLVMSLATCSIDHPPMIAVVAVIDVDAAHESGVVEVIVHPGEVERHTLSLKGRELVVTAPTSVVAYSWNASDVWTATVRANELMAEPVQLGREERVAIALPRYAAIEGTFPEAAFPDLLHIVFFPTAQYSPFRPQKPAGYERYQENYNRINKHRWASIDWVSGTFELLDLLPETSYTIEFWDAASHDAGTPLVVTTVTLGAANSVTTLAVN